jgi:hypothetical protein
LIAAAGGLALVLWRCPRPWTSARTWAVVAAVWVIVGASVYLGATHRFGQGVAQEDRSITHRIELWKVAPRMIMDAPGGWGLGNAGQAYMEWYQPLERTEFYRTLVNSHLTWLVELAWPWRVLYLLGWSTVLALCWPTTRESWLIVPFAVWVSFAIGAFFSSVAESTWLWIVPGLLLLAVLIQRFTKGWPPLGRWVYPPLATLAIIGVVAGSAAQTKAIPISYHNGGVKLGSGEPALRVFPSPAVFGNCPGRSLREYWLSTPESRKTIILAQDPPQQLSGSENLIVTGGQISTDALAVLRSSSSHSYRIILLNPAFFPEELDLKPSDAARVRVIFGEFSGSPAVAEWESLLGLSNRSEGVGDFLPDWPKIISTSWN